MSWEPFGFMVFSNIEAFAWCALCMSIFRFKISEYVWEALVVVTLMNLQSFVLRDQFSLAFLVPLVNVAFFSLLFYIVAQVPWIGALTMTVVGLIGFVIVQTFCAIMLFGSVAGAQETVGSGYVLQATTAAIVMAISILIYRYGYGFSYNFSKFSFRFERLTVFLLMVLFLIIVTVVLYLNDVWINIPLFAVSLLFFLAYAGRKERDI